MHPEEHDSLVLIVKAINKFPEERCIKEGYQECPSHKRRRALPAARKSAAPTWAVSRPPACACALVWSRSTEILKFSFSLSFVFVVVPGRVVAGVEKFVNSPDS